MQIEETPIPGVKVLTPKVFNDERGFFLESYNRKTFENAGILAFFVQDNHSFSIKNVLRGMHYQAVRPQDKLVRCVSGEIFDVAVDIRKDSETFGKWFGIILSAANKKMLWVPQGMAHGFLVLSDSADVLYKTTARYYPEHDRCIRWDDPDLKIQWPIEGKPIISDKDLAGKLLKDI
jgi:dTDP-4-dehydrorhamnose 3,5-epimerase